MGDRANLIVGPASISLDGIDMGFISEDGITVSTEFGTIEYMANQTTVTADVHRNSVRCVISVVFNELTLEIWRMIEDLSTAPSGGVLTGSYGARPTTRQLVITMPGPNDSTRTLTCSAVVITPGDKVFSNNAYMGAAVEFLVIGDAATNEMWVVTETASSTAAPSASSYQHIASNGTETAFVDNSTTVPDDSAAIQITFNVNIRPDMVNNKHFILKTATGNTDVSCTVAYGTTSSEQDMTKVKLTPASALASTQAYDLIIPAGLLSVDGVKTTAAIAVQFTTTA